MQPSSETAFQLCDATFKSSKCVREAEDHAANLNQTGTCSRQLVMVSTWFEWFLARIIDTLTFSLDKEAVQSLHEWYQPSTISVVSKNLTKYAAKPAYMSILDPTAPCSEPDTSQDDGIFGKWSGIPDVHSNHWLVRAASMSETPRHVFNTSSHPSKSIHCCWYYRQFRPTFIRRHAI